MTLVAAILLNYSAAMLRNIQKKVFDIKICFKI